MIVHAYWWKGKSNFGDELTPALMKHFGFNPSWINESNADLIMVGSVLSWIPPEFKGVVLGAGLMCKKQVNLPHARYLAVRGAFTRDMTNAPQDVVLGDPGLLAGLLIIKQLPEFALGIVPHFNDKQDATILDFIRRYSSDVLMIDIQHDVDTVLKNIAKCQAIVSTSLHGLVAADALGFPAAWLKSENVAGDGFKFKDYHSAFGVDRQPIQ